jgi:hypothetical protein
LVLVVIGVIDVVAPKAVGLVFHAAIGLLALVAARLIVPAAVGPFPFVQRKRAGSIKRKNCQPLTIQMKNVVYPMPD